MIIITLFIFSLNYLFVVAYTNLALGKIATSSSIENISFDASKAVDGDKTTRWASIELQPNPEWIEVDLGSVVKLNEVDILWEASFAKEFQIQLSFDGETYETVAKVKSDREVILDKDVELEDYIQTSTTFNTKEARYVKIYCSKKGTLYGYSIYELEIYYVNKNVPKSNKENFDDDNNNKWIYFSIIGGSIFFCALIAALLLVRRRRNDNDKNFIEKEFNGDYIISPVIPGVLPKENEKKDCSLEEGNMSNAIVAGKAELDITLLNSQNNDTVNESNGNSSNGNVSSGNNSNINNSNINNSNINNSNINNSNINISNINGYNVNESNVNGSNGNSSNRICSIVNSSTVNVSNANVSNANGSNINRPNMNESNRPDIPNEVVVVQNIPPNSVTSNNNLPFTTQALEQPHSNIPLSFEGVSPLSPKKLEVLQNQSSTSQDNSLPTYSDISNYTNLQYLGSLNQFIYYPNGSFGMINMNNGIMMNGMSQPFLINNAFMNNMNNNGGQYIIGNYCINPNQDFNNMNGPNISSMNSISYNYTLSTPPSYPSISYNGIILI
ncbi:hypothetical protein LY90DRAFT_665113 [Neocallimastix californiae]|uniref:F5/8 type C domain-containing protein n=1 Tax=Neocallimastix californiae TaxID=1754190 RepID=A0A1Y2F2Z5_9FUNG|nr:hypothetical protein LY90DRAFT_665113 [Neocallimastix californiae]|eukprot:ORY77854.1 hypothetical protein LY90DRAFT_665113 [Neocallimastix californiae]